MDKHSKVVPLQLHPMGFIEVFTRLGANPDALLDGTGINRSQLERAGSRISYAQQTRLVQNGIRACARPGIGLLMGMELGWCFFGPLGYVVECSPSLREAGVAFRRFQAIAQPYYALVPGSVLQTGVLETSDWYVDSIVPLPASKVDHEIVRFELEFRLATYLRICDLCGDKSVDDPSVHVRLGYPEPTYSALYNSLPCASITFGCATTQVAMHRDFLLNPWREYRRPAFCQLVERCEEILRQDNLGRPYSEVVRAHINEAFDRTVTLEEIAERLCMTPRTLSRRLACEGTTFRAILHHVRMELTMEYLRLSQLRVEEIAELMGFSCASSLRRAVKRWSGWTAGEIRTGLGNGGAHRPPSGVAVDLHRA